MSTEGYGSQAQPKPTSAPGAHDVLVGAVERRLERTRELLDMPPRYWGMQVSDREFINLIDELRTQAADDEALIALMRDRRQLGLDKYGTLLQHDSGRDHPQDLVEELADAIVYAVSWRNERKMLLARLDEVKAVLEAFRGVRGDHGVELWAAVDTALGGGGVDA